MLASSIMMKVRRTTVSASSAALATLEAEAARRGEPVAALLREALEEKARTLRASRRPHVAVGHSTDGASAADLTSEPVAEEPR